MRLAQRAYVDQLATGIGLLAEDVVGGHQPLTSIGQAQRGHGGVSRRYLPGFGRERYFHGRSGGVVIAVEVPGAEVVALHLGFENAHLTALECDCIAVADVALGAGRFEMAVQVALCLRHGCRHLLLHRRWRWVGVV